MKIIDRYVLGSFIKNWLISFMVLIGMYIALDMVFNFDEIAMVRGSTDAATAVSVVQAIRDIADYYFYQCFMFFVHLAGIIPVVAAAFTLMRLSRFNELTATLAAGVPLLRVAMPIIICGVVLNALMITDQELIIPMMLPKLTRSHDELHRQDVKTFPIQAMQDSRRGLLYAARYTPPTPGHPAVMEKMDVIERAEAAPAPTAASPAGTARPGDALPAAGHLAARPVADNVAAAATPATSRPVIEAVAHIMADRATWNEAEKRWDLETWNDAMKSYVPHGLRVSGLSPTAPASRVAQVDSYQSNINPEEIALYRSGDWVELLPTSRIDELIARPGSYGQSNLLRVKHWRFVQPIMNVILLLLAIPCVLTREPGRLKSAATKCLLLTGLGMGSIFLSHQIAGNPPSPEWAQTWPAIMAWLPIFIFGPLAVFLLDRVKT